MLTIEPPFFVIRGITILREDTDLDQFYYLPPMPVLAHSAAGLAFTLYKYRRDLTDNPELDPTRARGAGLALFEVEMPLPRPALLQAELAALTGRPDARLSPVLFRAGSVHAIIAHAAGDSFIEDLAETHKAPLTTPHHTSFALALSAEGATLFEQAARGGSLPVGVAYELRFLALTPALHARVRMHYERIYDHFAASIGFTYYVSVKLDLDLTWLIEHGFIEIEITAFTDGADKDRQQQLVMNLVKAQIQRDFFRSGLPPKPQEGAGGPLAELLGGLLGEREISSASALFVLKAKLEVVREQKQFELYYNGRTAVELTHVATGFISTMIADEQALNIREIDLDDPFFSVLEVGVISVIDFEEMLDLREAAVHLSHGDHRISFRFARQENQTYRFQIPLTDPRADQYAWEAEYHFDPDLGGGLTVINAGPFASRRRVLILDPIEHFQYRRLRVLLGPVDPSSVPRVMVRLRLTDPETRTDLANATFTLDSNRQEELWRLRLPLNVENVRLRVRSDWEDPRGVIHAGEEEELDPSSTSFVALGPFRGLLTITVQTSVDWQRVSQLLVEIRYQEGDYLVERSINFVDTSASQRIEIPVRDPQARRYRWRQIIFHQDGTANESAWAESEDSFLVAGREPRSDAEVRVMWVGAPGETLGLRLDFWVKGRSEEVQTVAAFLRAGEDQQIVTVPLDAEGRLDYRYEVRRFTATGEELLRAGESQSNLLVVQASV
ncbi:MAG: hypothetical protein ACREV1_00325 [Gammaproteobacteria bacterium]